MNLVEQNYFQGIHNTLHSSWYWEAFIQSSCQIPQFLRSKNRQKGDKIFLPNVWFLWKLQSSLLISYMYLHCWWMFGWYLICRSMWTDFFYILRFFIGLKNGSLMHAQTGSLSMQICMYGAFTIKYIGCINLQFTRKSMGPNPGGFRISEAIWAAVLAQIPQNFSHMYLHVLIIQIHIEINDNLFHCSVLFGLILWPGVDWVLKPAVVKISKGPFCPFLCSFFFVSNQPWAAQNQAAHVAITKTQQWPVRLWLWLKLLPKRPGFRLIDLRVNQNILHNLYYKCKCP